VKISLHAVLKRAVDIRADEVRAVLTSFAFFFLFAQHLKPPFNLGRSRFINHRSVVEHWPAFANPNSSCASALCGAPLLPAPATTEPLRRVARAEQLPAVGAEALANVGQHGLQLPIVTMWYPTPAVYHVLRDLSMAYVDNFQM